MTLSEWRYAAGLFDEHFRQRRTTQESVSLRTLTIVDRLVQRLLAWSRSPLTLDEARLHCRSWRRAPLDGNNLGDYRDGLTTEWFEAKHGRVPVMFLRPS